MREAWAWLLARVESLLTDNTVRLATGVACVVVAALLLVVLVALIQRQKARRAAARLALAQEPVAPEREPDLTLAAPPKHMQPVEAREPAPGLEPRRPLASHPLRDGNVWRVEAAGPGRTQPGASLPQPPPAGGTSAAAVAVQTQAVAREVRAMPHAQTVPASEAVDEAALDERADEMYRRALALVTRTGETRVQALRDALAYFRQALEIWTRERAPERWAAIQNDIGRVYQERPDGDRASHLRTAIMYHQSALEVFDSAAHPMNWAWTQAALGAAYQSLPAGSSIVNARAAVAYFQRALDIFSRENAPLAWAWNQNNLGAAYETMRGGGAGERVAHLRDAATCYETALQVYTATEYSAQHQVISRNLARVRAELQALE